VGCALIQEPFILQGADAGAHAGFTVFQAPFCRRVRWRLTQASYTLPA
jgi:hypothetical protein